MVVLDVRIYLEVVEIGWSGFGNQTVQFGGRRELVSASVLASIFTPKTLFCSTTTSSGLISTSCFTSLFVEDSLSDPAFF
jgi:hypothetical protein